MDALAGQCIEEHGQRRHEGLAFARGHFGDLAFVEHHAAEELHVVVDHVPLDVVAAGEPVGGIDGFVAFDRYEILRCGQLAVEVGGRNDHRVVLREAARRVLHHGEGFGQDFVEFLFDPFVDALGRRVDLLRDLLLLFERGLREFQLGFQLDDAGLVLSDEVGDPLHQIAAQCAEFVVREFLDGRVDGLDPVDVGLYLFAVFVGFRAEEQFDDACCYIH